MPPWTPSVPLQVPWAPPTLFSPRASFTQPRPCSPRPSSCPPLAPGPYRRLCRCSPLDRLVLRQDRRPHEAPTSHGQPRSVSSPPSFPCLTTPRAEAPTSDRAMTSQTRRARPHEDAWPQAHRRRQQHQQGSPAPTRLDSQEGPARDPPLPRDVGPLPSLSCTRRQGERHRVLGAPALYPAQDALAPWRRRSARPQALAHARRRLACPLQAARSSCSEARLERQGTGARGQGARLCGAAVGRGRRACRDARPRPIERHGGGRGGGGRGRQGAGRVRHCRGGEGRLVHHW